MKKSALICLLMLLSACGPSLTLYDVERVLVESCEITPEGEFCDDVGAAATSRETIAIERNGEITTLFFGEQTWVSLDDVEGERSVEKEERVTRDPGPCTTITTRTLRFTLEGNQITGTFDVAGRVEGNEVCGETPRGARQSFTLSGEVTNAI